jgi:hypothetical protein
VNVYVVVVVLSNAGDHVPVIPLLDAVRSALNGAPEQIASTCVNVGLTVGITSPPLYVKLAEVAEQDEALVAVMVYEAPVVPPVITPPAPTTNPVGVEV